MIVQSGWNCKDRSWNFWSDWPLNDLFQNSLLIFTADNNDHLTAAHDRSDSHGVCLSWNIFFAVKEALCCLDRCFSQIHAVSLVFEMVGWLVEADVSVVTKPENLDVSWSDSCESVRCMPGSTFRCRFLCRPERMYLHVDIIFAWKRCVFMK